MVDEERVTRLLGRIRQDVETLRGLGARGRDALVADEIAMHATKYCLLTAIEGCARVAHHLIASEGWSPPETNAAAFRELSTRGVTTPGTGDALAAAAGLRNILVHQYADVDDGRVVDHLEQLGDLDRFAADVAAWLDAQV